MNTTDFLNDIPLSAGHAAHAGTSFTPDVRANQEREGYAATLAEDYESLLKCCEDKPGSVETLNVEFARYREGYRVRYMKKLASSARCISWMITGPANFPSARNEKRNRVAHRRLEELLEFRNRALDAIRKTLCPELRPIMSGDADATTRLAADIAEAEKRQEQMKTANSIVRKFIKDHHNGRLALEQAGFTAGHAQRLFEPDCFGGLGFASFELTNNGANIRRMKQRLEGIKRNQAIPASQRQGTVAGFEDCPAENRVRLTFPGKPSVEIRTRLKSSGFRWAPSIGVWQAYRHPNTIALAQEIAA